MLKKNKLFCGIIIYLYVTNSLSQIDQGFSSKTKPIEGFAPYMASIAAYQDNNDRFIYDNSLQPVTFVGATLHLPSLNCSNTKSIKNTYAIDFYNFADQDADTCDYMQKDSVKWYILDSGIQDWMSITSWDEVTATEITNEEFPGSILPPNTLSPSRFTNALVIPEAALNKHIGFVHTPISSTGIPKIGPSIKAWDLNYYWGQKPNPSGIRVDELNNGVKLDLTKDFSGGGMVMPKYNKPEIRNLTMSSDFTLGEKMKAEYEFISNNSQANGDHSRLWWGEKNTISKAKIDNLDYSLGNYSPVITENELGRLLEVTILPITFIEPNFMLVGNPVTSSSYIHPPLIANLSIDTPLTINTTATATYDFFFYNSTPKDDTSFYSWQLIDSDNNIEELMTGRVTKSGKVELGPKIELDYNGKILRLVMIPSYKNQNAGIKVSTDTEIEKLVK